MVKELNVYDFVDEFKKRDRMKGWTHEGLTALYNYLEELSEHGEAFAYGYNLDVIALDCEFTQYDNFDEVNKLYGNKFSSIDKLAEETTVIRVDNESIIIADF